MLRLMDIVIQDNGTTADSLWGSELGILGIVIVTIEYISTFLTEEEALHCTKTTGKSLINKALKQLKV